MKQVSEKHWQYLGRVLENGIKAIDARRAETFDMAMAKFIEASDTLGLVDLVSTARKFLGFRSEHLTTGWNEEAAATLSFSMGTLLEKMQSMNYGPDFLGGLDEVSLYLDFFAEPPPPDPGREEDAQDASLPGNEAGTEPEILPASDFQGSSSLPSQASDLQSSTLDLHPQEEEPATPISPPSVSPKSEHRVPPDLPPDTVPVPTPVETEISSRPFSAEPAISGTATHDLADEPLGYVIDFFDWYKELLAFDPASPAFEFLAEEFCLKGMWQEAAEICRRGLIYHPRHLRGHVLLGWALWKLGEWKESEKVLDTARKDLEKNAVLYRILAEIADHRKQREQSLFFMDLYHRLGSEEKAEFTADPVFSKSPGESRPTDGGILDLLEAWILQTRTTSTKTIQRRTLFEESDRQELKELLRKALH
ncbi:MAG: hypothetical protein KBH99_06450 [Syntrophobacteraceae bacterium]|nr:hypothetical protein [Syntrophobacteraceae bacterium]